MISKPTKNGVYVVYVRLNNFGCFVQKPSFLGRFSRGTKIYQKYSGNIAATVTLRDTRLIVTDLERSHDDDDESFRYITSIMHQKTSVINYCDR